MKNGFDINSYLHEAEERFSGFDGYEDFDGGYDDFDGFDGYDDFDGFDGYYEAAGGGASQTPTPYQIVVTNTTNGTLAAELFGKNKNLLATNFGSAVGIDVAPAQSNVSYVELLQQSAEQPFETSLIRIQSSNASQVTQIITITSKDANGQSCSVPVITQSYFSANQFQSGIIDVPHIVRIDGNSLMSFNVLPLTSVTITLFPANKVNLSKTLSGGSATTQYGRPAVSAPVAPNVPARVAAPAPMRSAAPRGAAPARGNRGRALGRRR
jgi:hypothetical protein